MALGQCLFEFAGFGKQEIQKYGKIPNKEEPSLTVSVYSFNLQCNYTNSL